MRKWFDANFDNCSFLALVFLDVRCIYFTRLEMTVPKGEGLEIAIVKRTPQTNGDSLSRSKLQVILSLLVFVLMMH